jgi:hypothetical protein
MRRWDLSLLDDFVTPDAATYSQVFSDGRYARTNKWVGYFASTEAYPLEAADIVLWQCVVDGMPTLLVNAAEPISVVGAFEQALSQPILFEPAAVDYTPAAPHTPIVAEFVQRIADMKSLQAGWDGYGAEPPSALAREWAVLVLQLLPRSLQPFAVSPSSEGGVALSFGKGERVVTIECLNDGSVLAVRSDRVNAPRAWELSGSDGIRSGLSLIAEFLG